MIKIKTLNAKNFTYFLIFIFIATLYFVAIQPLQTLKIIILPIIVLLLMSCIVNRGYINKLNYVQIFWVVTIFPVVISTLYSTDSSKSMLFCILYILLISIFALFSIYEIDVRMLLKFNLIFSTILVLITLISKYFPGLFQQFFFPILVEGAKRHAIYFSQVGTYAGISGQTGTNAFLILIGIGILIYRDKISFFSLILTLLSVYSLVLSGKRGLVISGIISIVIVYLFFYEVKNKTIKYSIFIVASIFSLIIAILNFNSISRFLKLDSPDFTSGRLDIYYLTWELFLEKPILGWGIDSFTSNPKQLIEINVHNIYLQLLMELGFFGSIFIFIAFIATLYYTYCLNRKIYSYVNPTAQMFIRISAFVQILFLVYGIAGNPFYDYNFFTIYLCFVGPLVVIENKLVGGKL